MKASKNERGYGLLEVMIGLLIFTAILIPVTKMMTIYFKQVTDSGIKVTALNLAQSKLEEFKNIGAVDTDPGNFPDPLSLYSYSAETYPGICDEGGNVKTVMATVYISYRNTPIAKLTGEIEK